MYRLHLHFHCQGRTAPAQCGMPHARVVQALASIALLQLRQIQASAEMRPITVDHGGAHLGGHGVKQIAQGQDQAVVQGVALGRAGQADHGDFLLLAAQFEMDVWMGHGGFRNGAIVVIVNNQFKQAKPIFVGVYP